MCRRHDSEPGHDGNKYDAFNKYGYWQFVVIFDQVVDQLASTHLPQEVVPLNGDLEPSVDRFSALAREQQEYLLSVGLHVVTYHKHSTLEVTW